MKEHKEGCCADYFPITGRHRPACPNAPQEEKTTTEGLRVQYCCRHAQSGSMCSDCVDQALLQERQRMVEKVVLYVSPIATYSELSHEDRLKLGADEVEIYLGDSTEGVWGDDWNDAPDEHNSGRPYEETVKGLVKIKVKLGSSLLLTDKEELKANL